MQTTKAKHPTCKTDPEPCACPYSVRANLEARSHILVELAHKCLKNRGTDVSWNSIFSTPSYFKGSGYTRDLIVKVLIEDSPILLKSGLVAVHCGEDDEDGSVFDGEETANLVLQVVPEKGKLIVYECDIDLLNQVGETRGAWVRVSPTEDQTVLAIPLTLLKAIATDSFVLESEFYDRLLATDDQEEDHA